MKNKIIIKSIFGEVLFEYEKEDNTIKDTVEEAVKKHISLSYANLNNADLNGANLEGINLSGANLCGANICGANFKNVNLYGANLTDSNLYMASLNNTVIYGINLYGVDLSSVKNMPYMPMNLPDGEFIAWKRLPYNLIVKLKILSDSKRSRATRDKCRCDKALVLEFQNEDGGKSPVETYTCAEHTKTVYKVGEIVYADEWDDNRWNECSHGIHFFLDRQTAVNYNKML